MSLKRRETMRILLANVAVAEEESESGHFVESVLLPLWRKNLNLVKQGDTKLTFRFPKWGVTGLDGFFFSYMDMLNAKSIFHAAARAESEGFDAVMITCFGDPMLWPIRQAVDIPVVSLGESSMLLSTMMGHKFGVVTISSHNIFEMEHMIGKYGLKERYAGARPNPETGDEQPGALIDARHAIESFKKAARKLIADGAELLIPGCGLLSPALRCAPGAEEEYPEGLTEVDGVPVVDVMGETLKMAELLVALKKAGSSWISRKGLYARATEKALECCRMVVEDEGRGYWELW
jgi:Asp/Glu/hydantoin racemase